MIRHLLAAATIAVAAVGTVPVASADPMSDLIGMLPPGYAPDSCHGGELMAHALAALSCNEVPGRVPQGAYSVFENLGALNRQFDIDFDPKTPFFKPLPCPGAPDIGPGTIAGGSGWTGRLACGVIKNETFPFAVMWTNESGLLWAQVCGPNLIGLFDWFNHVVGPS